ncbi:MAG: extracellular solute-binding protein [Novosphingobium sp.]|uniref:extracellular solute-binding protein n=1 Tax=Novosphingobium sp. TaxID=1874826 RepID=UPI0022C739BD|nr:extracellular solute-binding protein [Novosphingobium sp.]MCZ8036361.1 extracellular solute-binding protein [Novosphingobium sp.]
MDRRQFIGRAAVLSIGGAVCRPAIAQSRVRLTLYTSWETDTVGPLKAAFEADVPGVELVPVRDSSGIITARLLAEKDNPRADVTSGLPISSLVIFEQQNMLQSYTPQGVEALKPRFRSNANPMTWTGTDAFLSVIVFNRPEGAKIGANAPLSWQDLLQPALRGHIVMPNPASSATGYVTVAGWLKTLGESAAWQYMDKLHENIATYLHSGSAPVVSTARGERVIGIGSDLRAAREKTQGAPIDVIVPKEGLGWDMSGTAILRGTRNLEAAQRYVDWTVGKRAHELTAKAVGIVGRSDVQAAPPNFPPNAEASMVDIDIPWMAANRDRILAEWNRRYSTKSPPR